MKRLVVALAVLAAIALLAILFWPSADETVAPAPPPSAADAPIPPPALQRVPRVETSKSKPAAASPAVPVAAGVLDCEVAMEDEDTLTTSCSLRVLLPTGVEVASQTVAVPGTAHFEHLPTGVPLVVAADATGCLSGLCCDVRLAKRTPATKRIALLPAPLVMISVTSGGRSVDMAGLRVELLSGEVVVADGRTERIEFPPGEEQGERAAVVALRPTTFGELRARVSFEGKVLAAGVPVVVEPTTEMQPRTIDILAASAVAVQVLSTSGAPARGVEVWLLGETPQRPPVTTNDEGVAYFLGLRHGMKLTAVARGEEGTFASVVLTTDDLPRGPAPIPLLLGEPMTLSGDVVDQGNGSLRGATVEVIVRPGTDAVTVTSDATGLFETQPLAGGLAEVLVRCDGYLDWRSPEPVEIRPGVGARIRARMTPCPTGSVYVRVRDESGAPVANADVNALPSRLRGTTDAEGLCRFDRVASGSDQTFYARCRGYRSRAGALPTVRVQRDTAVTAHVVLRAVPAEPPEAGPVTATGVVLDPDGEPVVAARVTAGATVAFTDAAGRFRLNGLDASAADPVDLLVTPAASLLETLRVLVKADDEGRADLGTVRLRARPYALLEIPDPGRAYTGTGDAASPSESARAFWLSSNHADTLLGGKADAFQPIACVSYDGTWLHLPPADDWTIDGRGEVFVAFSTPRGLFTSEDTWTLAPDASPRLALPALPLAVQLPLRAVADSRGKVTIRQLECASLFDPRAIHVPTGDAQPTVDPFAPLAPWRVFVVDGRDLRKSVVHVAPGKWRVTGDDNIDTTIDVGVDGESGGSAQTLTKTAKKPGK